MGALYEVCGVLLIVFGAACLVWVCFGRLLWPVGDGGSLRLRAVILAHGDGSGLEHTVRGLLWMQRAGLWRGTVVIADEGLNPQGQAVARRLIAPPQVELLEQRQGGAE